MKYFIKWLSLFVVCYYTAMAYSANHTIPQTTIQVVESIPRDTTLQQVGPAQTQACWLNMIGHAEHSIQLASFYFSNKPQKALADVIDALQKAAQRGVNITLLTSDQWLPQTHQSIAKLEKLPNVKLIVTPYRKQLHGVMHAKYMVVDNKLSYLGSANFDWRALTEIHETGLLVNDSHVAKQLGQIFEADIAFAKHQLAANTATPAAASLPAHGTQLSVSPAATSPTEFPADSEQLLKLIEHAKKSIAIQTLYYSPADIYNKIYWPKLDLALRQAAWRGVKVKLLVSHWSIKKPRLQYLKSLNALKNIEVKYIEFPQTKPKTPFARVDHSKFMVIDNDYTWVSTANWEPSYFTNCRNVSLTVANKHLNQQFDTIFTRDWRSPYAKPLA